MQKELKLTMLGAGSGFVLTIANELLTDPVFENCTFTLMDPSEERLAVAVKTVGEVLSKGKNRVNLSGTTSLDKALADADYVITSCEKNRYSYWAQDFEIAEKHGVFSGERRKRRSGGDHSWNAEYLPVPRNPSENGAVLSECVADELFESDVDPLHVFQELFPEDQSAGLLPSGAFM